MISRDELASISKRSAVAPAKIEKDYVFGWLLSCLYANSPLGKLLVLKGGSCLKKGYFEHARYAGDLDFSSPRLIHPDVLRREFSTVCSAVQERTGVTFIPERLEVRAPKVVSDHKVVTKIRLRFWDFSGQEAEQELSVGVDCTQFDRLYLPVQERELIHPYSDAAACAARIRCVKLEEVLASKMRCLLQRAHPPDLFDLAYGSGLANAPKLDLGEVRATFLRSTVFQSSPRVAKGLLLDLPFDALSGDWSRKVWCSKPSRISLEAAKQSATSLIDELIPGQPDRSRSDRYFGSPLRNPILAAGRALTLLRIHYAGTTRVVEPYSLVFRELKDGIEREYFYVYDRSGGSSGRSTKSFLPDKALWAENTNEPFQPRCEVELGKAGGVEMIRRFQPKRPPPFSPTTPVRRRRSGRSLRR